MMLGVASDKIELTRLKPVFEMQHGDKEHVYAQFAAADVIFSQRITDEYNIEWTSSNATRKAFGQKLIVWPNIYFDGYFPGVQYVYLDKWGKLLSPLGEYHFSQVRAAFAAGKTIAEAVEAYSGERLFETSPDPVGASLGQLRKREPDVDVVISDAIAEGVHNDRQFYTPNHPTNALLATMLDRLTQRADITIDHAKAAAAPYRLDECYIAASPAIVNRLDWPFDRNPVYRGREILSVKPHKIELGGPRDYDPKSLVEAFYRLYDSVAACNRAHENSLQAG
jgi:hypothetical protein